MKPIRIAIVVASILLGGCAAPSTLKSPCAGAPGSPCSHTPLLNEPIEVPA